MKILRSTRFLGEKREKKKENEEKKREKCLRGRGGEKEREGRKIEMVDN